MRYSISSPQVSHFRRERFLDLEDLITAEETYTLKNLIDQAYAENQTGRDLERGNLPLKKALQLSRLGQIASILLGEKRLRLVFSQYAPPFETASLDDVSPVTDTLGGCVIDLTEGRVIFYPADEQIDFEAFENPIILLGIAKESGRYRTREKDPHTHQLKKLGYASGDKLREDTHPLIIKQ